jgi:hypothetical protein
LKVLVDAYQQKLRNIAYEEEWSQEVRIPDPRRPPFAEKMTMHSSVKVCDGRAFVKLDSFAEKTGSAPFSSFLEVYDGVNAKEYRQSEGHGFIHGELRDAMFRGTRFFQEVMCPPTESLRGKVVDLSAILGREDTRIESTEEELFGERMVKISAFGGEIWIDVAHGGIPRKQVRPGYRTEIPELLAVEGFYIPKRIVMTKFENSALTAKVEPAIVMLSEVTLKVDSVRLGSVGREEFSFEFPHGTVVHDKISGLDLTIGGEVPDVSGIISADQSNEIARPDENVDETDVVDPLREQRGISSSLAPVASNRYLYLAGVCFLVGTIALALIAKSLNRRRTNG